MKRFKLFVACFALMSGIGQAQELSLDGLVLIGNKTGYKVMNRKQISTVFRGNQSIWPSREPVAIVMPSFKAEYANQFSSSILQMSHSELQKYWLALVFQGRANAPVFLNSSAEIIDYVKNNPGAIGIVKANDREIPVGLVINISDR